MYIYHFGENTTKTNKRTKNERKNERTNETKRNETNEQPSTDRLSNLLTKIKKIK